MASRWFLSKTNTRQVPLLNQKKHGSAFMSNMCQRFPNETIMASHSVGFSFARREAHFSDVSAGSQGELLVWQKSKYPEMTLSQAGYGKLPRLWGMESTSVITERASQRLFSSYSRGWGETPSDPTTLEPTIFLRVICGREGIL